MVGKAAKRSLKPLKLETIALIRGPEAKLDTAPNNPVNRFA
jgi:hypothetical protein